LFIVLVSHQLTYLHTNQPQRTPLQSEAERLLAGARDLEESIGVSLSARRFEVRCARCGSGFTKL